MVEGKVYWVDANGLLWIGGADGFACQVQVTEKLELTDYDRDLLRGMKIAPPEGELTLDMAGRRG